MARKQIGMIDEALLERVDECAAVLGQTRRVYVERALEAAIAMSPARIEVAALKLPGPRDTGRRLPPPQGFGQGGLGKGYVAPRPKGKK